MECFYIRFCDFLMWRNINFLAEAPLVADLFLFCYESDFTMSLSDDKQADIIDAFNTTSRYMDDMLNINNIYFDNMVSQIYPSELPT